MTEIEKEKVLRLTIDAVHHALQLHGIGFPLNNDMLMPPHDFVSVKKTINRISEEGERERAEKGGDPKHVILRKRVSGAGARNQKHG